MRAERGRAWKDEDKNQKSLSSMQWDKGQEKERVEGEMIETVKLDGEKKNKETNSEKHQITSSVPMFLISEGFE